MVTEAMPEYAWGCARPVGETSAKGLEDYDGAPGRPQKVKELEIG
jgi:hypothetical protein